MKNKMTEEKKITITEQQLFNAVMDSIVMDEEGKKLLGQSPMLILLFPIIAYKTWEVLTKEGED